LVQQLLEYKKYKMIADQLKDLESIQTRVWPRGTGESQETVELLEVSIFDLIQAISGVFSRLGKESVTEIKADTVRVELEMERIVELMQQTKTVQFQDLFKGATTRIKVIGIFLAILELVRVRKIRIYQASVFGEIYIHWREK
jgi:segregation and condensation protein A